MSGRLLNVSLQQPTAASSEPAADSESPPSAPSEARRPLMPPVAGLFRSFAWGSMLVGPFCLAPRWTPFSHTVWKGTQMPVVDGGRRRFEGELRRSSRCVFRTTTAVKCYSQGRYGGTQSRPDNSADFAPWSRTIRGRKRQASMSSRRWGVLPFKIKGKGNSRTNVPTL